MQSTHNYKYLVAEDERLIRQNLIKKIGKTGLPLECVGEVANGREAIDLLKSTCPDLVITDIRMPECDGIELASYIYQNHPEIKVAIISGYDDFSYAQAAIKYNVKDYLLKPIDVDSLTVSLQKILITMDGSKAKRHPAIVNNSSLDQKDIYELLKDYLIHHYKEDLSLQELSDEFGFTLEYLGKIFKKYSGLTLSKYLTQLRMNEAKRLLTSYPDLEIQKIGEMVGYKDAFYFSRAFKNYTGKQPSAFRK